MYNIRPEKTITGKIKCKNCGAEIKWHYIIHAKEFGIYLNSYPTDTASASKLNKDDDSDNTYFVRCKNCDKKNYFQYTEL